MSSVKKVQLVCSDGVNTSIIIDTEGLILWFSRPERVRAMTQEDGGK